MGNAISNVVATAPILPLQGSDPAIWGRKWWACAHQRAQTLPDAPNSPALKAFTDEIRQWGYFLPCKSCRQEYWLTLLSVFEEITRERQSASQQDAAQNARSLPWNVTTRPELQYVLFKLHAAVSRRLKKQNIWNWDKYVDVYGVHGDIPVGSIMPITAIRTVATRNNASS